MGATSGTGPEGDVDALEDTGEQSQKSFMFPNRQTAKATKKMLLKHNLCKEARGINIIPRMHTSLVSIPKLADVGYTTVLRGPRADIYNDKSTIVTANKPPVLFTPRCNLTGLWKLVLDPAVEATKRKEAHPMTEEINVLFYLPSARQSFLC